MDNFTVVYRNYGHWDIVDDTGRKFRIRGGPGAYVVMDERSKETYGDTPFNTVQACMGHICDKLMFELIIAEGQEPTVIESWNVT